LLLEMGWDYKEQRFPASTDCYTSFLQELNQGDSFEIRSGVIESDSQSMKLGHKLFNSETGELCTTMEQLLNEGPRTNMKSFEIDWDGEPRETGVNYLQEQRIFVLPWMWSALKKWTGPDNSI